MDNIVCAAKIFATVILVLGMVALVSLIKSVNVKTTFLCTIKWFTKYTIISQRFFLISMEILEIRRKYKEKTVREMLSKFDQLFREDFEEMFTKLEYGVHYRVVTHYADVMDKAVKENKIRYIKEPKLNVARLLKEIRPLVGWKDYRIIKRCLKANPNIGRCCDKCSRFEKCQCRKGGVCRRSAFKKFYEYNFELTEK